MGKRIMRSSVDGPVEPGDVVLSGCCRVLLGCPPVGARVLDVLPPETWLSGCVAGVCVFVCCRCGSRYVFG